MEFILTIIPSTELLSNESCYSMHVHYTLLCFLILGTTVYRSCLKINTKIRAIGNSSELIF